MTLTTVMESFNCFYCNIEGPFTSIVPHCMEEHITLPICIRKPVLCHKTGKHLYQTVNFKIVPTSLKKDQTIICSPNNIGIKIINKSDNLVNCDDVNPSKRKKLFHCNSPIKFCNSSTQTDSVIILRISKKCKISKNVSKLGHLLPSTVEVPQENN